MTDFDRNAEIVTTRHLAFPAEAVFAAFADPARLALWWGPAGFRNTITTFDFQPGGTWRLTMHGPDGTDYPNESRFVSIEAPSRIVFDHLSGHFFQMTIGIEAEERGTRFSFRMRFADADEAARVRGFVLPANEENFDRLVAHLRDTAAVPLQGAA